MSSFVRRLQIRVMKGREVEKVPNPFGWTYDTGMTTEKGEPVLAPVLFWPKFAPKTETQ